MMVPLDIVILIIVGLGGLSGFRTGFTRSVWGIAAISAGIFTASQLWRELAPLIQHFIKHESIAKWTSILIIIVGVGMAVDIVFDQLQRLMAQGVLKWINHTAGAVLGIAVSSFLIGCVLLLLERHNKVAFNHMIADSRFAPSLLEMARQSFDFGKLVIEEQLEKM
jgi:uncharacterized membrane protein required for colicin V production